MKENFIHRFLDEPTFEIIKYLDGYLQFSNFIYHENVTIHNFSKH